MNSYTRNNLHLSAYRTSVPRQLRIGCLIFFAYSRGDPCVIQEFACENWLDALHKQPATLCVVQDVQHRGNIGKKTIEFYIKHLPVQTVVPVRGPGKFRVVTILARPNLI